MLILFPIQTPKRPELANLESEKGVGQEFDFGSIFQEIVDQKSSTSDLAQQKDCRTPVNFAPILRIQSKESQVDEGSASDLLETNGGFAATNITVPVAIEENATDSRESELPVPADDQPEIMGGDLPIPVGVNFDLAQVHVTSRPKSFPEPISGEIQKPLVSLDSSGSNPTPKIEPLLHKTHIPMTAHSQIERGAIEDSTTSKVSKQPELNVDASIRNSEELPLVQAEEKPLTVGPILKFGLPLTPAPDRVDREVRMILPAYLQAQNDMPTTGVTNTAVPRLGQNLSDTQYSQMDEVPDETPKLLVVQPTVTKNKAPLELTDLSIDTDAGDPLLDQGSIKSLDHLTPITSPDLSDTTSNEIKISSANFNPKALVEQTGQALIGALRQDPNGPIRLRLNPEELGHIEFEMKTSGPKVHVLIHAERPEILDFLRRHSDQLVAEMRSAGFSGTTLGFNDNAQSQNQQAQTPPAFQRFSQMKDDIPAETEMTKIELVPPTDRLDLRL